MQNITRFVHDEFKKIPDEKTSKKGKARDISLCDCLMTGLAVFSLKSPSLLSFDQIRKDKEHIQNIENLFLIGKTPSDTYLRERLDVVDPDELRPAFKVLFAKIQRQKVLESYVFHEEAYLIALDGTQQYSSKNVHCENCNVKNHKNGEITYYHQILGAVLLHPDHKEVFPLMPEIISKQDGSKKNDCERNAAKRWIQDFRREHPHLKVIFVEDGLASNAPHIKDIQGINADYILGAKPGDHVFLFDWVEKSQYEELLITDDDGTKHYFKFINQVPLNGENIDLNVNFLEYIETTPKGDIKKFSWVTSLLLTKDTVYKIMRGGRSRWRIENETFNTLKNQGYHFDHNFGHGKKNLCSVFIILLMLAFFLDQIQQRSCSIFQQALEKKGRKKYLWQTIQGYFELYIIKSWDILYMAIIKGIERLEPVFNTS